MWNDLLGTLGKAIEDVFSEDAPKIENDLPFSSATTVLPNGKVNSVTNDEDKLRSPDIIFQENVESTLDNNLIENFFSAKENEEQLLSRKTNSTMMKNINDVPLLSSVREPVLEDFFDHSSAIFPGTETVLTAMRSPRTSESSETAKNQSQSIVAKRSSLSETENGNCRSTTSPFSKETLNSLKSESSTSCEPHQASVVCSFKDEKLSHEYLQAETEDKPECKSSCSEGTSLETIQKHECGLETNVDSNQMKSFIEKLESDNTALNYLNTELKEKLKKQSDVLKSLQAKIKELQEENKRCNIEIFQLTKKNLNNDVEHISKLEEEKNSLEKETERLSSELQVTLAEYENRLGRMDIDIIEANQRANDAEMRFLEKEREAAFSLQHVRGDIESSQALLSQLSSTKSHLEDENESLRKENAKLKLSSHTNLKSLENIIAQQKEKINEDLSINLRMEREFKELEKQHSDCLLQLSQQEKEVESLKLRLLTAAEFTSNPPDSNKNAFSASSADFKGNYSWRTSRFVDPAEANDEDKSKTRLEQEVIRQALVIKDLRKEILSLQRANNL